MLRPLVGVLVREPCLPALRQIAGTIPTAQRGTATGTYMAALVAAYVAPGWK